LRGWPRRVADAIASRVASAHRAMRSAGRVFVGRAAVLAQRLTDRATSSELHQRVVPTIAAKQSDARDALRETMHAFQRAYRAALDNWCSGIRDTVFPFGTWWMRVHHDARIAAAPTNAAA